MSFDFFDHVFLLHLALKATKRILQRLAIAQSHFGHPMATSSSAQAAKLRMLLIADRGVESLSGERGKTRTKKWEMPVEEASQFHCYTYYQIHNQRGPLCFKNHGPRPSLSLKIGTNAWPGLTERWH